MTLQGETPGNPKASNLPENIERRLSMQQAERRRSMGNEDAEWTEAEKVPPPILPLTKPSTFQPIT